MDGFVPSCTRFYDDVDLIREGFKLSEPDKKTNQRTLERLTRKSLLDGIQRDNFETVIGTLGGAIWTDFLADVTAQKTANDQENFIIYQFMDKIWPQLSRLQSTAIKRRKSIPVKSGYFADSLGGAHVLKSRKVITEEMEIYYVSTTIRASSEEEAAVIKYKRRAVDKGDDDGKPIYSSNFGSHKVRGSGLKVGPHDRVSRSMARTSLSTVVETSSSSSSTTAVPLMPAAEDEENPDEVESVGDEDEMEEKMKEDIQELKETKSIAVRKDAAPAKNLAAQSSWPPAPVGTTYYICSSDAPSPGGSVTVLSDSPLNRFLCLLDCPILVLEKLLDNSGNPVNLLTTGSLQDDLGSWLTLVLAADNVSASATGTDVVSNFQLGVTVPLSNSTTQVALHYSTATPPTLIKIALPASLPFGYEENSNFLLFGLNFTASQAGVSQSWNLQQVLDYFGVSAGNLQGLVDTVGLAIDLTIINPDDPSLSGKYSDARNAVWFDASNYEVYHRLEFRVGTDVITTIDTWVKKVFANSITVADARMIGRLFYTRSPNGDPSADPTGGAAAGNSYTNMETTSPYDVEPMSDMAVQVHLTSPKLSKGITGQMLFNPTDGTTTFVLVPDPGTTIYDMVNWMLDVLGSVFHVNISDWLPKQSDGTDAHSTSVRVMSIQSDGKGIQSFSVDCELEVDFGKKDNATTNICFFVGVANTIPLILD